MKKTISVVELALALRLEMIPASDFATSAPKLDNLSAEDQDRLSLEAEKLLNAHHGCVVSAVSSIELPPAVLESLIQKAKEHQGNEETLIRPSSDTENSMADAEMTGSFVPNSTPQFSSRYSIVKKCGSGGLGDVYSAEDRQLNRIVALKTIRTDCIDSDLAHARFQTEAEITGRLQHPSIAPVYSFEKDESGSPYYTMRFIDGESLAQKIDGSQNLTGVERQIWLRQQIAELVKVIHAVEFAHSQKIIHRDIKPSNIMIGKFGESFLVDWGLARVAEGKSSVDFDAEPQAGSMTTQEFSPSVVEGHLTRLGEVVGTPAFMSPEQASGESSQVGLASDIYSLGATLFSILDGKRPFTKQTPNQILAKLSSGKTPVLSDNDSRFPKELRAICNKAMSASPSDRYRNASDLRIDLQNWMADEPVSAVVDSVGTRLRRLARKNFKAVVSITTCIFICIGLLVYGLISSYGKNKELGRLNDQLTIANDAASKSKFVSQKNFQHAQDVVGDFLVMVTEHRALKNGSASSRAFRKELLEKAKNYYLLFLEDSNHQDETVIQSVEAYQKLASIQKEFGEFESCLSNCKEAIRRLESIPDRKESDLGELKAKLLSLQGLSQSYLGQNESAKKSYEQSIAIREELIRSSTAANSTTKELAWTKNSYALLLEELGELEKADQLISNAFKIDSGEKNQALGSETERLQFFLTSSQIKFRRGEFKNSTRLKDEGVQLAKELLKEYPNSAEVMEYLAAFEQDIASDLNALGNFRAAKTHVEKAIRTREKIDQLGENSFQNELYLGTAYRLIAEIEGNLRLLDQAIENANRAIEKIQNLLIQEKENIKVQESLVSALMTRAKNWNRLGKSQEAFSDHQRAVGILRKQIAEEGESETSLHSLAQIIHNQGSSLKDTSEAMEMLKEAAEIIERLAIKRKPPPKVFEDAIIILGNYGELTCSTRSYTEGIEILKRRVDYAKRSFELYKSERFKDKWAWCMNDVAQNYSQNGQLDESKKWFETSKDRWETFSKEYQSTESYAQGFGGTLVNGSMAFRKRKEYQKAMEWLERAESLMKPHCAKESAGTVIKRFYTFGRRTRARLLGQMASDLMEKPDTKELERALEFLTEAEKYDHQNAANLSLKADAYVKLKRMASAIETLLQLELIVPEGAKESIRRRVLNLRSEID